VAFYGPDDKTTTKIVASVILRDGAEPILQKWMGMDVVGDPKIAEQIKKFFAQHGVRSCVVTDGNLGCPHEEGPDFPVGQDCPVCPFWAGKQGSARRIGDEIQDSPDDDLDKDLTDELEDEEEDSEAEDSEPDIDYDSLFARMNAIIGEGEKDFGQAVDAIFEHLKSNLRLPCEVTGSEDFRWEEPYVIGGWSPAEYKKLKKTQPSYTDRYQLLGIERDDRSEWMMFDEDIVARVQRISDNKIFLLGLAELEVKNKQSPNWQLLDDYAVWFVNSR